MLTRGDDFPIHQTPEPIAFSGTDRNFYDRYFFCGYLADGSGYFAIAFGVYPHLDVADAHVSVIRDGVQHCLHASRILNMERMSLVVGPIRIEVVEPLKTLRIVVEETHGISADLTFTGRAFPAQEPRFTWRQGARTVMDVTRMTQNGRWEGHISVDGARAVYDAGARGTRDRSWGVRPIGAPDAQANPAVRAPQFYWLWGPSNFQDMSLFWHTNDDALGRAWNTRAVIAPDGAPEGGLHHIDLTRFDVVYTPGTRRVRKAVVSLTDSEGEHATIAYEPFAMFQMKGIGYGHPDWGHGRLHGALRVEREDFALADQVWSDLANLHIQALSKVTYTNFDGAAVSGLGILEQLLIGAHAPSGFQSVLDGASEAALP